MIVTIDGPAGTGKSTAARALAHRIGFDFLDTGAMYRAVAWACRQRHADPHDPQAAAAIAAQIEIGFSDQSTLVNGRDVSNEIRSPDASRDASIVAQHPAVREHLVRQQQRIAAARNIVCEGRDQGTVAFPHAECKFFLTADPRIRAQRRQRELRETGQVVSLDELLADQTARDERDAGRAVAPLRPAADAIIIDTTPLTAAGVIDVLERHVRARMPA